MKALYNSKILWCFVMLTVGTHATFLDNDDEGATAGEFNVRRESTILNAQGSRGNFFRTSSENDVPGLQGWNLSKLNAVLGMTEQCESEENLPPNPSRSQTPPPDQRAIKTRTSSSPTAQAHLLPALNDSNRLIVALTITWVAVALGYFQLQDWGWF